MSIVTLRPIKLEVENISGMTTNLDFDSNLVIIYGYNRAGKTILIKCFSYVFNGFKQQDIDLNQILGENLKGRIVIVFTFKGILYKLTREITKSSEHITFQRSITNYYEYKQLPDVKKNLVFTGKAKLDIIQRTEIKSRGTSTEILREELQKVRLYPEIIDRLIAIENIQEFKNATQKFSTTGGGYEAIKDILYKDLKEKSDAIESIIQDTSTLAGWLEKQNHLKRREYDEFVENLKQIISVNNESKKYEQLIGILQLDSNHQENLDIVKSKLKEDSRKTEAYCQTIMNLKNNIMNKKDKYIELEGHLKAMELKDLEITILSFFEGIKMLESLFTNLSQIQRILESNPPHGDINEFKIDFSDYLNEDLTGVLKNFDLPTLNEPYLLSNIRNKINQYIHNFNTSIRLYNRRKDILNKYNIKEIEVDIYLDSYKEQLDKMENPIKFNKKEDIFNLYGRVEENSIGNRILKIYMPLSELNRYITRSNPLGLDSTLLPVITEDDNKSATEKIINELSKQIENKINELEELKGALKEIENIEPILKQNLNEFENDLIYISDIKDIVEKWNTLITEEKAMARNFIGKHSESKIKSDKFENIANALLKIQQLFIDELIEEAMLTNFQFEEKKSLDNNLKDYTTHIEKELIKSQNLLEIIKNLNDSISDNQDKYKKLCKDIELNETLKNVIIPLIQVICAQLKSNIQLNVIEEKVMNKIIKYAELFYKKITKEQFLKFEKVNNKNGSIYLRPRIRTISGNFIDIADDMPSGSEQGSIALGIMVALAKFFNGFIVIDETTDRFDYPSKQRFYEAIKSHSEDLFWIIVLKVDTDEIRQEEEFLKIREIFPNANILQPFRRNLKINVNILNTFEDWTYKEA